MRRKHKAKRNRNVTSDEKRLISTLKRIGVQPIPGIEEINMFKMDGTVIHFKTPKFQASGTANTYVVSGRAEHKNLKDLLPGILDQLPTGGMGGGLGGGGGGAASMAQLAEALKSGLGGSGGGFGEGVGDDDIPDLVENFGDEGSAEGEKKVEVVKEKESAPVIEEVKEEAKKEEVKKEEVKQEEGKKEEVAEGEKKDQPGLLGAMWEGAKHIISEAVAGETKSEESKSEESDKKVEGS